MQVSSLTTSPEGPFFIFLVPVFFSFRGMALDSPVIKYTAVYWALVSAFCECQVNMFPQDSKQLRKSKGASSGYRVCIAMGIASSSLLHVSNGATKLWSLPEVRLHAVYRDVSILI